VKKVIFFLCSIIEFSYGQNIAGHWRGKLNLEESSLQVVFNITWDGKAYKATMDSPDQGAKGIPVESIHFENKVLTLEAPKLKLEYKGTLKSENHIEGTFKQNGFSFPLKLEKGKIIQIKRPQEPKKPYPYLSEEVKFENKKEHITLAGTLTLPQKGSNFPAVVLISGSGAQNRNSEAFGHKTFLVLSDYLTRKGIAVLRFDDRGTAQSTGNFKTATSANFSNDAEAAVQYLKTRKEINPRKIGLIGHSEGGLIAPMIAARSNAIAFIVLLAAPGIPGDQLLLSQQQAILKASLADEEMLERIENVNKGAFELVKKAKSLDSLKVKLSAYFLQMMDRYPALKNELAGREQQFIQSEIKKFTPWLLYFLKYDPAPALSKVKCPVLALGGSKDLQVPAKENLTAIEKALRKGGNKKVTIKELPYLNHLFQESKTGLPKEYRAIEQTFSPNALTEISQWILKQGQ